MKSLLKNFFEKLIHKRTQKKKKKKNTITTSKAQGSVKITHLVWVLNSEFITAMQTRY
jgi:hypothetical protein